MRSAASYYAFFYPSNLASSLLDGIFKVYYAPKKGLSLVYMHGLCFARTKSFGDGSKTVNCSVASHAHQTIVAVVTWHSIQFNAMPACF